MLNRRLSVKGLAAAAVLMSAALALPAGTWARPVPNAGPPVPGGVYRDSTDRGTRVTIRVGPNSDGVIQGTLQVSCARGPASIHSANGTFVARGKGFAATGKFDVDHVTGRISRTARASRCAAGTFNATLSSPAGVKSTVVRYGPFALNPMSMSMGMPMSSNMFNMQGSMQDFFPRNVQKPCSNCYIVAMVPDLVYPNGKVANYNTGAMLHHFVIFNTSQRDVTCPKWPQRVFASGNERSDMMVPAGYGYHIGASDNWNMLAELMNMSMQMQNVEVQVTYYYLPASANVRAVTPMWLDENECGDSEYSIPAGHSDKVWNYQVPANGAGDIVAIGGHVHDYGTHISLTDTTTGQMVCNSRAGYGANMAYMKNIDSMSGCTGNPLALIRTGDMLRLDSYYKSPIAENNVMGIMVAYVDVGAHKSPAAARGKR